MNLLRRQFLQLAAGAVAAPAVARRAFADAYPSRPVRLIVGFTPAGGNDIVARLMGQWLTERLGQTFVIENRPGAGTNIAAELVIKSPPDGYTLFITNLSNAINATLYEKLNFDFMRDMLPVAGISQAPAVFAINSSVPAKTVTEFIAHAKANPGRINMGSAGLIGQVAKCSPHALKNLNCGPPGCGGPGPQAAGCPQPPGVYYGRRGYDRDGDEWRYRERRRFSRYRDPCLRLSPYGTYVRVCR
jgi:tripartite-type tricarboxylate transporter receptor subunit TctC